MMELGFALDADGKLVCNVVSQELSTDKMLEAGKQRVGGVFSASAQLGSWSPMLTEASVKYGVAGQQLKVGAATDLGPGLITPEVETRISSSLRRLGKRAN